MAALRVRNNRLDMEAHCNCRSPTRFNVYALAIVLTLIVPQGFSQVHLTLMSSVPLCFGSTVKLVCYYPTVLARLPSGEYTYFSSLPSWFKDGNIFSPGATMFFVKGLNATASYIGIVMKQENLHVTSALFVCGLLFADRTTWDFSSGVIIGRDPVRPSVPLLVNVLAESGHLTVVWNHSTVTSCYADCIFVFDVKVFGVDRPDDIVYLTVMLQYVNVTSLPASARYHIEVKASCPARDAWSDPLLINFVSSDRKDVMRHSKIMDLHLTGSTILVQPSAPVPSAPAHLPSLHLMTWAVPLAVIVPCIVALSAVTMIVSISVIIAKRRASLARKLKEKENESNQGSGHEADDEAYEHIELEPNPCYGTHRPL